MINESMAITNSLLSSPLISNTFVSGITNIVKTISFLFGGVFGVYLILLFLRWKEYLIIRKKLEIMEREMREINKNLGLFLKSEYNKSSDKTKTREQIKTKRKTKK